MPLKVIGAAQAQLNLRSQRLSIWPDGRRFAAGRMETYATVGMQPSFQLVPGETIFTIGSCFAREIERELASRGFDLPMTRIALPPEETNSSVVNDVLNKYIAQSMANELRWALDPQAAFPDAGFLQLDDDQWHDPHLVHNLKPASLQRAKERRAEVMALCQTSKQARVFVITLGLAEAWFDRDTGLYLNGAPPMAATTRYAGRFEVHVLSYGEILAALEDIHGLLTRFGREDFRILITVSPVPFKATFTGQDAMSANAYSKSVQRAAVEEFVLAHANVDYFPSYETVTLSERSAAFLPDHIHVRPELVRRIVGQVVQTMVPGSDTSAVSESPEAPAVTPVAATPSASIPIDPAKLYQKAMHRLKRQEYALACQDFRLLVDTFGDASSGVPAVQLRISFGMSLLKARQTAAAEQEFARAAVLEPDNALIHHKLGMTLDRLGRSDEALQCLTEAVRLDPSSVEFVWRLALHQQAVHDHEGARTSLQRVLVLEPGHPKAGALWAELAGPPPTRPLLDSSTSAEVTQKTAGGWWRRLFKPRHAEAQSPR
jgi:Flp pilus assembly protein TadD